MINNQYFSFPSIDVNFIFQKKNKKKKQFPLSIDLPSFHTEYNFLASLFASISSSRGVLSDTYKTKNRFTLVFDAFFFFTLELI